MPNQGTKGNRDRDQTTPSGTSGRKTPGGNQGPRESSTEAIPPQPDEAPRRRNIEEDEDSGLGNRTTVR